MNCDNRLALGYMEKPYKVISGSSSGIRFSITGQLWNLRESYCLKLLKKECPHTVAYKITLSIESNLYDAHRNITEGFTIPNFYNENNDHDYCLTWYDDVICLKTSNGTVLLKYSQLNENNDKFIGFVQFETYSGNREVSLRYLETIPNVYTPLKMPKSVSGGDLTWVKMNRGSTLPIDALIGGLEYEPLYIARAQHAGSLCPGKYVKSKQLAFIPWGHIEIPKDEFEVLCGYDAMWVKCNSNHIPENAFIAGYSELRHEPLFIGRAWIFNNLIVGKVHVYYKTCYLPYREAEVERSEYEILVVGNQVCRGETKHLPCYMKMNNQPCL